MSLHHLSIGKRLALTLGLILAVFVASSAFTLFQLRRLGDDLEAMVKKDVATERAGADWLRHTTAGVQRASAIAKSSDPSLIAYFAPFTAESIRLTNGLQKFIESEMTQPEERALYDKVSELRKGYLAAREEVSKLKMAGDAEGAARVFSTRFEPTANSYVAGVQQIVEMQRAQLDASARHSEEVRSRISLLLMVCSTVAVALGVLLAWLLGRSITRPLKKAVHVASEVAGGNLSLRIEAEGRDETAQLLQALQTMSTSLQRLVGEVRQGTDSIATASNQIASGNQDLSSRTEEQAASLQQTAASMGGLRQTVRENADSARQANDLAASASQLAQQGGAVVAQVVQAMGSIHTSSRRIADIIGVIDGIAFQRRRAPASRGAASPSWPPKCAAWRSARPMRRARSRR
jgi:methyl-accepting chemotaxis protein